MAKKKEKPNNIGKYVIIDLDTMDFFKSHKDNKMIFFKSKREAIESAWIHELYNASILRISAWYDENENDRKHEEYLKTLKYDA